MAHIVPLPLPSTLDATPNTYSAQDSFDVVVFLEHFQNVDSFSDQLMACFDAPAEVPAQTQGTAQQNLVVQMPEMQLAMTLRARQS